MYSVVLMAALTTGANAPDCWFHCRPVSCYGCAGCYGWSGCYGCAGCFGACHGCYGCVGCYGVVAYSGVNYACFGGHGCYGCAGYYGCTGYALPGAVGPGPEQIPLPKVEDKGGMGMLDRARLTVQVPADAKLYIDDQPMKSSSEKRVFSTPRLDRGQTYYYEVRAEVMRDGKPVTETKKVLVRAGADVTVSFPSLETPPVATADAARRR